MSCWNYTERQVRHRVGKGASYFFKSFLPCFKLAIDSRTDSFEWNKGMAIMQRSTSLIMLGHRITLLFLLLFFFFFKLKITFCGKW